MKILRVCIDRQGLRRHTELRLVFFTLCGIQYRLARYCRTDPNTLTFQRVQEIFTYTVTHNLVNGVKYKISNLFLNRKAVMGEILNIWKWNYSSFQYQHNLKCFLNPLHNSSFLMVKFFVNETTMSHFIKISLLSNFYPIYFAKQVTSCFKQFIITFLF